MPFTLVIEFTRNHDPSMDIWLHFLYKVLQLQLIYMYVFNFASSNIVSWQGRGVRLEVGTRGGVEVSPHSCPRPSMKGPSSDVLGMGNADLDQFKEQESLVPRTA